MGPVISVFVLVLIVSILAGLTFLFVSNLKATSLDVSERTTVSVINESVTFDAVNTAQDLDASTLLDVECNAITVIHNNTALGAVLGLTNVTQTDCSVINATALASFIGNGTVYVSYTYDYIADDDANAYTSINETENAGAGIVGYLPLIFLAIIFGSILAIVLKIILPYINLGQNMGGF